ncbi:LOW QUALITY PROTEIN: alpha-(1,3)-fucosyltransferase C-like [Stylophora pistillata]|uniref:LOW QUALITY PROTEIN: alpha-(1,3)-fucosyltransferase C-like n=1 Tax=Stylophora pistillata TaxID=50429 RepID=UPI000C04368C|nr:LOW QUALITY PROTEIN: alpha-(1,3)-fucosyltransferase C-like [Stylophora pistillata]
MITVRRIGILKCDTFLLLLLIFTVLAVAIIILIIHGALKNNYESEKWRVILFYIKIFGVQPTTIWPATSLQKCKVPWCILSDDRLLLRQSDAVIFHEEMSRTTSRELPRQRSTNQRWVYFVQENPHYTTFESSKYNGVFNWTMTYKRSSDIWAPYGSYRRRKNTEERDNYNSVRNISAKKTRLVAWATSHCSSPAFLREQFAEQLQLHIPVDILGKCNPKAPRCPRLSTECDELLRTYKFYLAIENGLCEDYITEKYSSQALQHDMVPVVMGGANYPELAIPKSYMNVLHFPSIEKLALYLKGLDQNSSAYNERETTKLNC